MKKICSLLIFCICLLFIQTSFAREINFSYRANVEKYGWRPAVSNGNIAGTVGEGLRMEALVINMVDGNKSAIQYCAHVQNIGWQRWQSSGQIAGTIGKNLRMEAVRIKLNPPYSDAFDIYYRAHVENGGWLGWAKNGEPAGTAGASLRLEAVQIKIVAHGSSFNRGGRAYYEKVNSPQNYI